MTRTLTARCLVTPSQTVNFPVITINEHGTILDISSDPKHLEGETTTLGPALFDIHMHGAKGVDVMSATPAELADLQRFLAAHGVAHYLPTTVTAPLDFTFRALEKLATLIETPSTGDQATPVGIHIEGPFLSYCKRGMHPAADLQSPSIELFEQLQQAANGHIKLMTIAPEPRATGATGVSDVSSSAAVDLIRHATQQGVRCSVGHSNATALQTIAAIEAGAVSATHTFNAMRAFDHREIGILGTVLDDQRLFADLICDGVHVSPAAVRLWWNSKGPERAILITDSLAATGMTEGTFKLGTTALSIRGDRALVADDLAHGKETLAGSVLTLDRAVSNLCRFTGSSIQDASRSASHNPAVMLGLHESTNVAVGSAANLTRFDEQGNLIATYIRGRQVER